jgi:hypothetical protein
MMFANKYGKEFVAAAAELMPDCGVNRQVIWHTNLKYLILLSRILKVPDMSGRILLQIIELLSIRPPPVDAKMKLLKEISSSC